MLILYLTLLEDAEDKSLFEKLYYSYRKQMITVAQSVLQNNDDAEDTVHEVFLRIAVRYMDIIRSIEDEKDLRNYLLKATKNTALNMRQKKKRDVSHTVSEEYLDDVEDIGEKDFVETICERMDYEKVVAAVQNLREPYREALYYHFVMELSVSETAKLLNRTKTATKKQLLRGKKMLIKLLEQEGVRANGDK